MCIHIIYKSIYQQKKEHKKKKLRKHLRGLIIISAVVYLSTQMIYLNSLKEAVDFYYGEESSKVTVIKGEKSAVVFTPTGHFGTEFFWMSKLLIQFEIK